ncbi:MAG: sucrase ferredoxin [Tetrasphaera sp.]
MRPAGPSPCSDAARDRDDPLIATAPPTRRWLLLEQHRAWPEKILTSHDLAGQVRPIVAAVAQYQGRVLFVRRPGRAAASGLRRWAVIDPIARLELRGVWEPGPGLAEAVAAFAGQTPLANPAQVRLLVCTHGKHDQCCAVRGRAVARHIAARYPVETWECSHVGGDRFAANLIVLPSGTYYGGLDPDAVDAVLDAHRVRQIPAAHLRGVTTVSPVGQAGLIGALRELGPGPLPIMRARVLPGGGPDRWQVEVAGHPRAKRVVVEVSRVVLPPARRTCRAAREEFAVSYATRVVDPPGVGEG